ncbi:myotubularin-related [Anaeramoeba flamelloides]|uniref:Myotubularin-related n=1 Tax=Anaeramoeba flamelloides TaxID=1746091 RepID=A0AAV7YTG4_9EUKA|nr:myotubularin-related [Anaeramoeba flamelloides]
MSKKGFFKRNKKKNKQKQKQKQKKKKGEEEIKEKDKEQNYTLTSSSSNESEQFDFLESSEEEENEDQKDIQPKKLSVIKIKDYLLEGESIKQQYENLLYVYLKRAGKIKSTIGNLLVTNARLIFVPLNPCVYLYIISNIPTIFLGNINKIEKLKPLQPNTIETTEKSAKGLEIECKDFQIHRFYLTAKTNTVHRSEIISKIEEQAYPKNEKFLFCYSHKVDKTTVDDFWEIYNPIKEFQRMKVNFEEENFPWRRTEINETYLVSPTYPIFLVTPSSCDDQLVKKATNYRTKKRLPILTYYHSRNGATITRGSQPRRGFKGARSEDDEKYLSAIRRATDNDKILYIFDCRPKKNAVGNRTRGGGYEIVEYYDKCKLQFLGIDNIHAIRRSLAKLRELCFKTCYLKQNQWYASLSDTKWFFYIQKIIYWSVRTAHLVGNKGNPVFVHCSDGWDRTAQICALSELLIDPYYRTIEGFEVLIEKDWLRFGHKFHQRIGHGDSNHEDSQRSPIFLQWIECVYQILRQEHTAFEFNEQFLIFILDNLFSAQFGTFLFNKEQERVMNVLNQNTYSLWREIHLNIDKFKNNLYVPTNKVLTPSSSTHHLIFWEEYYFKSIFWKPIRINMKNENLYMENKKKIIHQQFEKLKNNGMNNSQLEGIYQKFDLNIEGLLPEADENLGEKKTQKTKPKPKHRHKRNRSTDLNDKNLSKLSSIKGRPTSQIINGDKKERQRRRTIDPNQKNSFHREKEKKKNKNQGKIKGKKKSNLSKSSNLKNENVKKQKLKDEKRKEKKQQEKKKNHQKKKKSSETKESTSNNQNKKKKSNTSSSSESDDSSSRTSSVEN